MKEKYYGSAFNEKQFDLNDGYFIFKNGEHLCGQIGKNIMGGTKQSFFIQIINKCNLKNASKILNRFSKLSARLVEWFGITFSLRDVKPSDKIQ